MSEAVLDTTEVRKWKRYDTLRQFELEWLPDVPAQWVTRRLSTVCEFIPGKAHEPFIEDGAKYICVNSRFVSTEGATRKYCTENLTPARTNDTLMVMSDLPNGRALAKAFFVREDDVFAVNQRVCIIRPGANQHPRFVFYLLDRNPIFLQYDDGANQTHLPNSAFTKFPLLVPSLKEQRAITAFLDRETARIDALVAKKKRLIELLEEKRQAVICHAVTKGLDPNAVCAESGVEWIGEIPQHWTMPRVSSFCTVVRGASPRPAGDPQYFNGSDTPWITVAETTKDKAKYLTETSEYLTPEGKKLSRFLEVDTFILTNSGATLGVPKILRIAGCINDGSVAFLNIDERISKDFLYYYFTSQTNDIRIRMNRGMGQPNLNTDIVSKMPVPCPPPEEQVRIAAYLDDVTEVSHCQCVAISRSIDLLMEHRVALISAAVTGQIDVRGEVQL